MNTGPEERRLARIERDRDRARAALGIDKHGQDAPNPGSDAAIAAGCICPVLDNGHGRRPGPWGFIIVVGCPVHAPS